MASQDGEQYDWNLGRSGREYPEDSAANEPDPFPFVETEIVRRRGRGWIGLGVFLVILVVVVFALAAGAWWYAVNLFAAKARSSRPTAPPPPLTRAILPARDCGDWHGTDGSANLVPTVVGAHAGTGKTAPQKGVKSRPGCADRLSAADIDAVVAVVGTLK